MYLDKLIHQHVLIDAKHPSKATSLITNIQTGRRFKDEKDQ